MGSLFHLKVRWGEDSIGYAVVFLQDVVKNSCSGGTPKKGVSEYYEDGNIPWLRTQEVVFRDICKTECFITESAVKKFCGKVDSRELRNSCNFGRDCWKMCNQ